MRCCAAAGPFIAAFWHNRLMMAPQGWREEATMNVIISRHRDGESIARAVRHLGVAAIRGSRTRGGAAALRTSLRLLRDGGYVGITPDGPRGPRMRVQPGVIAVARLSGAPIVPATYAVSRRVVAESWDRFVIALPFSRGIYVWGEPIHVDAKADEAAMETARLLLEERLIALAMDADRMVGVEPIEPAASAASRRRHGRRRHGGRLTSDDRGPDHAAQLPLRKPACRAGHRCVARPPTASGQGGSRPFRRASGPARPGAAGGAAGLDACGQRRRERVPAATRRPAARDIPRRRGPGHVGDRDLRAVAARAPSGPVRFISSCRSTAQARSGVSPCTGGRTSRSGWNPSSGPNLILETAGRGTPMLLVNARMSGRSAARWRRAPHLSRPLLASFAGVLAPDRGRCGPLPGARRGARRRPRQSQERRAAVCRRTSLRWPRSDRPSQGDPAGPQRAPMRARRRRWPRRCLRAPDRSRPADDPRSPSPRARHGRCRSPPARGLATARRSADAAIAPATAVYLVDTLGELGLVYRLADIAFVGGSLAPHGGHNPPGAGAARLCAPGRPAHGEFCGGLRGAGGRRCARPRCRRGRAGRRRRHPARGRDRVRAPPHRRPRGRQRARRGRRGCARPDRRPSRTARSRCARRVLGG